MRRRRRHTPSLAPAHSPRNPRAFPSFAVDAHSALYETAPAYVTDQPSFLNAAALVRVRDASHPMANDPLLLLDRLKRVEKELGREEGGVRFGPRPIDLDIIFHRSGTHGCVVWRFHPRYHGGRSCSRAEISRRSTGRISHLGIIIIIVGTSQGGRRRGYAGRGRWDQDVGGPDRRGFGHRGEAVGGRGGRSQRQRLEGRPTPSDAHRRRHCRSPRAALELGRPHKRDDDPERHPRLVQRRRRAHGPGGTRRGRGTGGKCDGKY